MDEWPALLYALLGSAVGGFFGALLQIRHERREHFRQLMLGAATTGIPARIILAKTWACKAPEV